MSLNKHIIAVESKGAKKAKKEIQGVSNSLKSMAKSAAAAAGAYFGARALLGAVQASIDLFKEQQLAEVKLRQALGKSIGSLQQYASSLQKVTNFGDELILQGMAQLAFFIKDEEQLKIATKASLDLASAKGMDLVQASDLVAKSVGSSTNALSRYGIAATGAVGSNERLLSITNAIEKAFGGQAEATTKSLSGAYDQLNNSIGDLQETLVADFAPALESSIRNATSFIEVLNLKLQVNQLEAFKATEAYNKLGDAALLQSLITEKSLAEQQLALEQNPILILEFAKAYRDSIPSIIESQVPMLKAFRKVADSLGFTKVNTDDLNAAWIGFKDSFKDDESIRNAENVIADLNAQIEELKAKIAGDGKDDEDDTVGESFEEYEKAMLKKFELMEKERKKEEEKNAIIQDNMAQFIEKNEDVAAALGLVTDATKDKLAAEAAVSASNKKMVSDLQVAGKEFKAFQKVAKAAAIAQTIYDTYEAAQSQFKQYSKAFPAPLGTTLGIAAAVAATAAGLARVQQIKKAQYGADFVTDGPQMMMVGEGSGPERVQVTPLADPNIEGPQGQGITLNISGNVLHESFVEDNIIPQIREGLRLGENMGV